MMLVGAPAALAVGFRFPGGYAIILPSVPARSSIRASRLVKIEWYGRDDLSPRSWAAEWLQHDGCSLCMLPGSLCRMRTAPPRGSACRRHARTHFKPSRPTDRPIRIYLALCSYLVFSPPFSLPPMTFCTHQRLPTWQQDCSISVNIPFRLDLCILAIH